MENSKTYSAHICKANNLEKPSVVKLEANRSETIFDKLQNSCGENEISNRSAFKLVK